LTIDAGVADRWGELAGDVERRGTPAPVLDGLMAATALQHHLTMATRNVQEFNNFNHLEAFNHWDAR
jgi:predicted nucleic acid-binding protein